jgi:hypothetical protein
LDFRKYFVLFFWSDSIRAFSVLLEDSLRIISETSRAGKKLSTEKKLSLKKVEFEKKLSLACGKNRVGMPNFWQI